MVKVEHSPAILFISYRVPITICYAVGITNMLRAVVGMYSGFPAYTVVGVQQSIFYIVAVNGIA